MSVRDAVARELVELGMPVEIAPWLNEDGAVQWAQLEDRPWSGGERALLELARSIESGALGEVNSLDEVSFELVLCALRCVRQGRSHSELLGGET